MFRFWFGKKPASMEAKGNNSVYLYDIHVLAKSLNKRHEIDIIKNIESEQ